MNKKVLIIGFVWPEPNATAAGMRMMQLIQFFLDQQYDVSFGSAAKRTELSVNLAEYSVKTETLKLNHISFDAYVRDLDPGIIVFDRFLTEEQYGWRIRENCPKAIRILDTEDLHFLRKARESARQKGSLNFMSFIQNDTAKREIASIYRCDLSLIISKFEIKLLREEFKIDQSLLVYLPFFMEKIDPKALSKLPSFEARDHFITMGNFKHQPNLDSVLYLKQHIWPLIRNKLPEVDLHIYGAYVTEKAMQLSNKNEGFIVKGWASDKTETFKNARVCLAPLRFGAGLKGKLLDAMLYGTPSVTTTIGSEGIKADLPWNGFVSDDPAEFARLAIELYSSKEAWESSQLNGVTLLNTNFDGDFFKRKFRLILDQLSDQLSQHRGKNFIGTMLAHHTVQSTKYLSKWIEIKNANAQ